MRGLRKLIWAWLPLAVVASGCRLGPDPELRPRTAAELADSFVGAPESAAVEPLDRWWLGFADPVTSRLVEEALSSNTDLAAAAARVLEAQAALRAARADLFPSLDASLSGNRQRSSFVLPQVGRVQTTSTTFVDDLAVSYQVDLFGRLSRSEQAVWADLLAAEAERHTVLHSVVAAVVRSRVSITTLERRLEFARATTETWKSSVELVERRYRHGLVEPLDVRLTRQSWAASAAVVPPLEASLARTRHALDVLLGRRPGTGDALPGTLPELPELAPPPVGLPVDLLERRPDLRSSRARYSAATARVGVALADLFPSLTLTASGGNRSDRLADLLSADTLVFNLVAGLTAPLLHGGQLRADVEAARARAEVAAQEYAGAVLVALREVEDALVSDAAERRRLEWVVSSAEEASAAARLARSRYERGTGGLLAFLESERRRFLAEDALIQARDDLWQARIDLFLALGGDWDAGADPEPAASVSPLPRDPVTKALPSAR